MYLLEYYHNAHFSFIRLAFSATPLLILGSISSQRLQLIWEWETIFNFDFQSLSKLSLLNTKDSKLLFIPFSAVSNFKVSRFKTEEKLCEYDEQFSDLTIDGIAKYNGFLIPLKNLHHSHFDMIHNKFIDYFEENKTMLNELIKARHTTWQVQYLDQILKIKHLISVPYFYINYYLSNIQSDLFWKGLCFGSVKELKLQELAFSSIDIYFVLSSDDFELICKVLSSPRTKFSLLSIKLFLNNLSEWLSILSLCAGFHELRDIYLNYTHKDIEDDGLKWTIKQFRNRFGFIENVIIIRNYNLSINS